MGKLLLQAAPQGYWNIQHNVILSGYGRGAWNCAQLNNRCHDLVSMGSPHTQMTCCKGGRVSESKLHMLSVAGLGLWSRPTGTCDVHITVSIIINYYR